MEILPRYESLSVEFKRSWALDKVRKTLAAFANGAGGDLYIGVADDGTVLGVDDPDQVCQSVNSVIRDSIYPPMVGLVETRLVEAEGKTVVDVRVAPGNARPYYLNRSSLDSIYIRVGNTTQPATPEQAARLFRESDPVPYEERVSREQDLTFGVTEERFREAGLAFEPKKNLTLGFWRARDRAWTNLARLFSDQCRAEVKVITFLDDAKTQSGAPAVYSGSVLSLERSLMTMLSQINEPYWEMPADGTAERKNHCLVDPKALREGLVNIIAHRDYENTAASVIHITPSAIEMASIGGLASTLTADQVLLGLFTDCRNKGLSRIFASLGLMENAGSGVTKIRAAYPDWDLRDLVEITPTYVRLRLPKSRPPVLANLTPAEQRAYGFASSAREFTRLELQQALDVSQPTANRLAAALVKAGLLEKRGSGPRIRYRLIR